MFARAVAEQQRVIDLAFGAMNFLLNRRNELVDVFVHDGRVKAWEVIRDARGAIVEYHVKLDSSGRAVKAIVAPGGTVRGARYEVPAEIEVPFAVPRAGR